MYQYKPSVCQSIQQGKEVKNIRKDLKKGPTKKTDSSTTTSILAPKVLLTPQEGSGIKKGKTLEPVYSTVCTKTVQYHLLICEIRGL